MQCEILCIVFDFGINYFDFVNNYGLLYGSVEINFGWLLKEDFWLYCDELLILMKVGWDMWLGLYGSGGGLCKYVFVSFDQSLQWMGFDYVDIFYLYCFDVYMLFEEMVGVLVLVVQQGKVFYIGILLYLVVKMCEMVVLFV